MNVSAKSVVAAYGPSDGSVEELNSKLADLWDEVRSNPESRKDIAEILGVQPDVLELPEQPPFEFASGGEAGFDLVTVAVVTVVTNVAVDLVKDLAKDMVKDAAKQALGSLWRYLVKRIRHGASAEYIGNEVETG